MKVFVLICSMMSLAMAQDSIPYKWVTVGSDAVQSVRQSINGIRHYGSKNNVSVLQVRADKLSDVSHLMHHEFKRCGGFVAHESLEAAVADANAIKERTVGTHGLFVNYSINQPGKVIPMVKMVEDETIQQVIEKLANFHNRYYKSKTGIQSQEWLKAFWEKITERRTDAKVEFFKHDKWPQPSVILTIEGSVAPDEVVIIGGHADSINSSSWDKIGARAPGADDNASGIATVSEVIRVLLKSGYKPARTVKFMAYAAEEVGLLGSSEIAQSFKDDKINVVGVMQLDMTNYKGTSDKDIVLMSDYTNKYQNEFLTKVIDTYLQIPWGYSKCGYGCSDHASWHRQEYPASMPFESMFHDYNPKIHSTGDTLEQSGGDAKHAAKFAKMAVAFMVELAK